LAPKVYTLKNQSRKRTEIIKIKGLTKEAIFKNNKNIEVLEVLFSKTVPQAQSKKVNPNGLDSYPRQRRGIII